MAILEKIRKRSLLLIVVIGVCLLAFLIGDLIGGGKFTAFTATNIGEVDGEVIERAEFAQMVENVSRSGGANASTMQAVNQVWDYKVNQILLQEEFDKLGIDVQSSHIINLVKSNPQIAMNPQFQNENGVFDNQKFIDYIASLKETNPQEFANWGMQEEAIINSANTQNYYAMIRAGLGVTEKEGEASYADEANTVNFKYVQVPYNIIVDSTITVSDSEIEAYINKHKEQFEKGATRSLQYVLVEDAPSDADVAQIEKDAAALVSEFKAAEDVESFVNDYSDVPYDSIYVSKTSLPAAVADTLFNLNIGEVYGPYKDGDFYKVSRMVAKKPNGNVKASHILITYDDATRANPKEPRTKEEAEALAKDILSKAKAGQEFADLAKEYSEDPGSVNNGGTYDNIAPGRMVPEFNDYIFNNPIGSTDVVETEYGFHVIRIDDQYEQVNVATVAKEIVSSQETIDAIYNKTNKIEYDLKIDEKDINEVAEANGLKVRRADNIEELSDVIPGLTNQRQIVRWAFESGTSVGDVSKFNVPSGYVIAQVSGKSKAGLQSAAQARVIVQPILRKEKKAALIKEKLQGKSMADAAAAYSVSERTVDDVTLKNPTISGAGFEPAVVGTAFAIEEGKTSGLIEGELGVYMIQVTKKVEATKLANYTTYREAAKSANVQGFQSAVNNALKEKADIEDNRNAFY